jgi:hypothetical protein
MSLVAAFLLAAAVQAAPADAQRDNDRAAQVESARIAVTILRPAVLKNGTLASAGDANAPRSQRRSDGASITYAFE